MARSARSQVLGMAEELALVRERRDMWRARYEAATKPRADVLQQERALAWYREQYRQMRDMLNADIVRERIPIEKIREEYAERDRAREARVAALEAAPETQDLVRAARAVAALEKRRADQAEQMLVMRKALVPE